MPWDCSHGIPKNLKDWDQHTLPKHFPPGTPHFYTSLACPCPKPCCAKILAQALQVFEEGALPPCTLTWAGGSTLSHCREMSLLKCHHPSPAATLPHLPQRPRLFSADGQTAVNLRKWLQLSKLRI